MYRETLVIGSVSFFSPLYKLNLIFHLIVRCLRVKQHTVFPFEALSPLSVLKKPTGN